jgi:hypothetical protein
MQALDRPVARRSRYSVRRLVWRSLLAAVLMPLYGQVKAMHAMAA